MSTHINAEPRPLAVVPIESRCGHESAALPRSLPDEIEQALDTPVPASIDKVGGPLRLAYLAHHRGWGTAHLCALLRLDRPATRVVQGHDICVAAHMFSERVKRGWPATDTGNSEQLALVHGLDLAWCPELGGWLTWSETHWQADDGTVVQGLAKKLARQMLTSAKDALKMAEKENLTDAEMKARKAALAFATQSGNLGRIRAMAELVRSEPGIAVPAADWDSRSDLLAVGNGVLELARDGARLRPHTREDRITRCSLIPFVPDATGPLWTRFIERAVPDPQARSYLQRLAGYSLLGGNPERLLIILTGPTSTGKSTFLETVGSVLGGHAKDFSLALFRAKRDEAPRPDLVDALPARFLHTTEAGERWQLHADELKRLTGGDTVRARTLHSRNFVVRRPDFTCWIGTNSAPAVVDPDTAVWRRLAVVPFAVQVDKNDEITDLGERLRKEEATAVLTWLTQGWDAYCREGIADVPLACTEAALELRADLSTLDRWLAEGTESGPEYCETLDALWSAYRTWCLESGVSDAERGTRITFGKALTAHGYGNGYTGPKDKRQRARTGLRLHRSVVVD